MQKWGPARRTRLIAQVIAVNSTMRLDDLRGM
jgi:hypothetical protein